MARLAFVMQLHKDCEAEYKRRHDVIWPELQQLLKANGISNYSIFLHPKTLQLFAFMQVPNAALLDTLSASLIMQKWWLHMRDIMETNDDASPVSQLLEEYFYLP
jgi:L-rhamnose mutarotase